jgi:hypothetical protein
MRPNPFQWWLYCYGAGLPHPCDAWVLRDVTTRGWQLRHMLRVTVALAPVAVALYVLIPGEPWVRAMAVLGGMLMGWFYGFAYMDEATEHRAVKAGHPRGAATAAREAPKAAERAAREERYAQRWR